MNAAGETLTRTGLVCNASRTKLKVVHQWKWHEELDQAEQYLMTACACC